MNKLLLLTALAAAGTIMADAHDYVVNTKESPGSSLTITWTDNTTNDMNFLAFPTTGTQPFFTASVLSPDYESEYSSNKFTLDKTLFEFNFSQKEWLNGDATASRDGYTTSKSLPSGAKITSISIPGSITGGTASTVLASAYLKNANNDMLNADLSYNDAIKRVGQKYADSVACTYRADGILVDLPLEHDSLPFIYNGTDIIMGLSLDVPENAVSFQYGTAAADKNLGTAIHGQQGGKNVFNTSAGEDYGTAGAVATFLNLKRNVVPAAQVTYYTNDIRFKITDINGKLINDSISDQQPNGRPFVRVIDASDGNKVLGKVEVDEDGTATFTNVDYTHKYSISAASNTYGYITVPNVRFEDAGRTVENDILVEIKFNVMPGYEPPFGGVEAPTAASFKARGGNGEITIDTNADTDVTISDLAGRIVKRFTAAAGSTSVDGLSRGIYIVNRTKVAVK